MPARDAPLKFTPFSLWKNETRPVSDAPLKFTPFFTLEKRDQSGLKMPSYKVYTVFTLEKRGQAG